MLNKIPSAKPNKQVQYVSLPHIILLLVFCSNKCFLLCLTFYIVSFIIEINKKNKKINYFFHWHLLDQMIYITYKNIKVHSKKAYKILIKKI